MGFFLTGLSISNFTRSQTSPADCKLGCTSNDVQIQTAYLSDINGNKLPATFVCPVSGTATVYLTLELTTKTPRIGVVIYAKVKNFTPPAAIGSELKTISECFGKALNQPTNKVTFASPFDWTCGMPIVLTDVFLGWGTGNTNFCTGNGFQCPATSSKCYSLPPGQYIPIVTPNADPASATLCSTQPGGTTADFNLTSLNSTVSAGQSNVTVTWFTDAALTNAIATPASYTSGTGNIYAKVTSNVSPFPYSSSTVTLTVNSTPAAPSVDVTQPTCAVATGTITVTSPTGAGITYSIDGINYQASATFNTVAPGPYNVTSKANGCPSSATSKTVNAQPATPAAPGICVTQPSLCGPTTGSVTIKSPIGAGFQYSINNGTTWQTGTTFSNLAPGSVTGIKVQNSSGCISSAANCDASDCSSPQTALSMAQPSNKISSQTTVRAYPNPFNNDVKFVVNAAHAGNGTLEIFNVLGQKIKTVYHGYVPAGVNNFDLNLPGQKNANLIYRFILDNKLVTGKLIQLNQ